MLRDAPAGFATTTAGSSTRPPVLIVAHMADLISWAVTLTRGEYVWKAEGGDDWSVEVERFFSGLAALDGALASNTLPDAAIEKLIQGPMADAFTHVGQLSLLRGIHGAPVRPEAYARAGITRGRVGLDQPASVREFDGDASVPKKPHA